MDAVSPEARRLRIAQLIRTSHISSQAELAELLAAEGITASQGTLSRDLVVIGAVRVRGPEGTLVYAPADAQTDAPTARASQGRLARMCREVMTGVDASANLAVVKTPPGAAQYFASAVDDAGWAAIIGCIAGDDTVLLISRTPDGGQALAERLAALASGHSTIEGDDRD